MVLYKTYSYIVYAESYSMTSNYGFGWKTCMIWNYMHFIANHFDSLAIVKDLKYLIDNDQWLFEVETRTTF